MNCKGLDFFELSNEILTRGSRLRFQARGGSMKPFIKDGDILEITPVNGQKIRLGDVIFYHVGDRRMVAHRVIKKFTQDNKPVFATKGDSNTGKVEEVHLEQIFGSVKAIERDGRRIRINQGLNRLMYIFYVRVFPLLTRVRRIGGRLLPHLQGFKAYGILAKRFIKSEVLYQWELSEGSEKYLLGKMNGIVISKVTIHNFSEVNSLCHGWWIFGMWVHWRYRGLGIGKRLAEMVCDFAAKHGASEVKLLVFRDNKPVLNLYQKIGFYQTSIPRMDEQLREEAKKTRRQRIIMKRDIQMR